MTGPAVDLYSAAFVARHSRGSDDGDRVLLEPGLCGVVAGDAQRTIRLLAIDDRAYHGFKTVVPTAGDGSANVFETASRCDDFMRAQSGWNAERPVIAMVWGDVRAVPAVALPAELVLRSVSRLTADAPGTVLLEDAAALAVASDPGISATVDGFAAFLRALPSSVRLFAAVDKRGVVRATSGCDVFGDYARLFFVNTEPGWRRQGVGGAMTVEAMRAAASAGARRAFLDATSDGASIYMRLGFDVAGQLTRYTRVAAFDTAAT